MKSSSHSAIYMLIFLGSVYRNQTQEVRESRNVIPNNGHIGHENEIKSSRYRNEINLLGMKAETKWNMDKLERHQDYNGGYYSDLREVTANDIGNIPYKVFNTGRSRNLVNQNGGDLKVDIRIGDDWGPCVIRKFCLCKGTYVYCLDGGRQLSYIPELPPGTTAFFFLNNYLPLIDEFTFSNLTSLILKELVISNNSLQRCQPYMFRHSNSIQIFYIANERNISSEEFRKCFLGVADTSIKEIKITMVSLSIFPSNIFSGLINSSVETLKLYGTTLRTYDPKTFQLIPKLRYLELELSSLTDVHVWYSNILNRLSFSKNKLMSFPNLCVNGRAMYPNLLVLDLSSNLVEILKSSMISCMKQLKQFSIDSNPIDRVRTNTFSDLPFLQELHISHIKNELFVIEPMAFNSSSLSVLYFESQALDWVAVDLKLFSFCPNLKTLFVQGNSFAFFTEDDFDTLLGPLKNLRMLILENTGIAFLPRVISSQLTKLELLNVAKNRIISWPENYFKSLTSLKTLTLAINRISVVTQASFPETLIERLNSIDLSANPFVCSCDLQWFISMVEFYDKTIHKFEYYPVDYLCKWPSRWQGKQIAISYVTGKYCFLTSQVGFGLIAATSSLVLFVMFGAVVYRYRWNIRYVGYMLQFQRRRFQRINDKGDNYHFDLFLSCSEDDLDFILAEIIPKLENEMGLNLFIPQRDGIGNKMDGIVNNMDASKKAILFISNSYVQDHFCEFEASLAYERYLYEKTNFMIVILLQEPDAINVTKTIYRIIKADEYILWCEEEEHKRLFWLKLTETVVNRDDLRA
ncbi:toll-like receptor 7 [Patella vulgata]|uniref:toll-like receptor 7 n=1 Tax=Patella vulgata TaxID=6465 RepID=UPI0024A8C4E9|nr:toll-like receptor 7 [Patella vulgata]